MSRMRARDNGTYVVVDAWGASLGAACSRRPRTELAEAGEVSIGLAGRNKESRPQVSGGLVVGTLVLLRSSVVAFAN